MTEVIKQQFYRCAPGFPFQHITTMIGKFVLYQLGFEEAKLQQH
jgi:hypothetical protein